MYMAAVLSAAPEQALELVGYQAIILDAMRRFPAIAVIRYDVAFRQLAARDATIRWDQRDFELLCGPADHRYSAVTNGQSSPALSSAWAARARHH